jgi:uncharacterized membrane protein
MNEVQLLGVIIFFAGVISYAFRDKPEFKYGLRIGFRIPYTLASPEAWKVGNTFVGIALMILGIAVIIMGFFLDENQVVSVSVFGLVAVILIGTYVSKRALEIETFKPAKGEVKPLKEFNVKPWLFAGSIIFAAYLLILLYTYPKLPEIIAIHFNSSGVPDNFGSKLIFALILPSLTMLLLLGLIYLAKEPFRRVYISIYSKNPEKTRKWTLNLLLSVMFLQFISFLDMLWFNLNSTHIFPVNHLPILVALLIGLPIVMMFISLFSKN